MNVLANDGISVEGVKKLNQAGFNVSTESITQEGIVDYINTNNIEVLLVRSATKARKDLIDECVQFPKGSHDDQVDAVSGAINHLSKKRAKVRLIL